MSTVRDRLGVQLYTVREQLTENLPETLEQVAAIGYRAVEVAGFPYEPHDLARRLRDLGQSVAGIHVPLNRLTDDTDGVLEEAAVLGTQDVICPWLPVELRSADGYRKVRETLHGLLPRFEAAGLRLSYHNHDFEFAAGAPEGDGLRYLLEPVDGRRLTAEFDVYWLAKAGRDPVQYMTPLAEPATLLHLKDMDPTDESFAAVGTGRLDFPAILAFGQRANVQWFIVEQDRCPGNPLDSLRTSWSHVTRMADALD